MNAHILIVDDDNRVTNALRRTLAYEGYKVSITANGEGALSIVRTRPPGLIILDLMLPGIDGLEVCRRLRGSGDDIPILMLTARDDVADRVVGLEIGADDYLVKPFALEELLARVKALLRRRNPSDITREVLIFEDLELDTVLLTYFLLYDHRSNRLLHVVYSHHSPIPVSHPLCQIAHRD
jgi:two-component system, OmpR family, response regulator MprA